MTDTAAPPGLRDWPAFQLWKCGWWLGNRMEREVESLGLRARHFVVLTMLQASDELSQQEMATYMSLDPTLMVALIDDLERDGLCDRARNPTDRRRYVVRITAKGRRLYRRARALVNRIEDDVFAALSHDERARLAEAMQRVMEPYWAGKYEPPRRKPGG